MKKMYRTFSHHLRTWLIWHKLPLPILINSVPKSGTNLLKNIVLSLPHVQLVANMPLASEIVDEAERLTHVQQHIREPIRGRVYSGHIPYGKSIAKWLEQKRIKQIIIYRDPRAVAVSGYHYLQRFKDSNNSRERMYFELFDRYEDDSQRLLAYIQGIGKGENEYYYGPNSVPNIRLIFDAYLPWIEQPDVLAVRYEDFVSVDGINLESGIQSTRKIMDFVGIKSSVDPKNIFLQGQNPEISSTYREGRSDTWRSEFTQLHHDAFNAIAGELLVKLGYAS